MQLTNDLMDYFDKSKKIKLLQLTLQSNMLFEIDIQITSYLKRGKKNRIWQKKLAE